MNLLLRGRLELARCFAKADRRTACALAAAAQDHFVAVLDEAARLAGRQRDGRLAGLRELEHRAERIRRRPGDGARAEQVARRPLRAVRRLVRDELRRGPEGMAEAAAR